MNEERNFKEVISEKYTKGEIPVLGRKDTFEFACVQCGECCRNREDILLNPFDFFRLCKAKEMTPKDFIQKYCETYIGYSSKLPLIRVKFRPVYGFYGEECETRCPFLGKKDGLHFCRVHKDKPFVCFAYPLGRVQMNLEKPEYILQTDGTCIGAKKAKNEGITQVVEDWMFGKEKLDKEEEFSAIFGAFLSNVHKWINLNKLSESKLAEGLLYKKWITLTADLLYVNYDFTSDEKAFLEQFKKNITAIEEISKDMVKEFASYINLKPKNK